MTNIKTQILGMVEKSGVKMIPRWQFVLYSSLGIIGLVFSFLLLVFISSFILFLLSKYGFLYLPLFGFGAAIHALTAIPILLILFGIILVIIIELLTRHYAFAFKKPLFVTISIIVIGTAVVGYVVSVTSFHDRVRDFARRGGMGAQFTHAYDRPVRFMDDKDMTVVRGVVIATKDGSFVVESFDETVTELFSSSSGERIIIPTIGDDVVVFGKISSDGKFEVIGIRLSPHGPFESPMKQRGNASTTVGKRIERMIMPNKDSNGMQNGIR